MPHVWLVGWLVGWWISRERGDCRLDFGRQSLGKGQRTVFRLHTYNIVQYRTISYKCEGLNKSLTTLSVRATIMSKEVIYFFNALSFGITGAPDCTRRHQIELKFSKFPGPPLPNGRGRPLPIHSPMLAPPTKEGAVRLL